MPDGLVGERADVALARLLGISRARASAGLESGGATIAGQAIAKSRRLEPDEVLDVDLAAFVEKVMTRPREAVAGLGISYDDDDIVIVDKPVGVAAHASHGWDGPNVLDALLAMGFRIATSGAQERQGIVQRLDVGTSGLMVVAKSERAYSVLKRAFKNRMVHKEYTAVCRGRPNPPTGTIDAPIARARGADYRFSVAAGGRHAVTHYETVTALPSASMLRIVLETGRTHQIRVHLDAIGHPLLGDPTYGPNPPLAAKLGLVRQFLHASRLSFEHPTTGLPVDVSSELPPDLAHAWEVLQHPAT